MIKNKIAINIIQIKTILKINLCPQKCVRILCFAAKRVKKVPQAFGTKAWRDFYFVRKL
jgi:hypothetical protein